LKNNRLVYIHLILFIMKNRIIKFLYKIFSFLADKTNGWKIFVSPKLFFGALVVCVTAVSTSSCKPTPEPPEPEPEVTCYFVGPPRDANQN